MRIWRIVFVVFLILVAAFLSSVLAFAQGRQGEKEEPKNQWAPTVNFLVGRFNTDQTSNFLGELFGSDLDLRGRSWDIGAARGRPSNSYTRITYSQVLLDDGSSVSDGDGSYVASGVKWKGFKIEKVSRLGPVRWPVAPMLSVHGGLGKISGTVTRTSRTRVTQASPKELFDGLEWLPIAGLGVGATATILDYATVTVSFYGMEFPGTYKGSLQITYWPWR